MRSLSIVVLLLAACSGSHPPAGPELPVAKVRLLPAGEIGERTWVPATVSAVDHAVLATRVSARVAELTVNEGAHVRRGDVLVRLSDDDVQATLKAAESQREVAESQVRRIQSLRAANAATASELDAAMTARADAVARMEAARATLADTVLRAPFDAVVQRKWVSRGRARRPRCSAPRAGRHRARAHRDAHRGRGRRAQRRRRGAVPGRHAPGDARR